MQYAFSDSTKSKRRPKSPRSWTLFFYFYSVQKNLFKILVFFSSHAKFLIFGGVILTFLFFFLSRMDDRFTKSSWQHPHESRPFPTIQIA